MAVGDILFAYETDKASFEEESKVEGTVLAVLYNEGDEIPVLTNVMIIGQEGENIDDLLGGAQPAAIGKAQGVLDETFFNAIIILSVVTTLPVPTLVRLAINKLKLTFHEAPYKIPAVVKDEELL